MMSIPEISLETMSSICPGLKKPEDVAVGVSEQQHDPQRGDLEPDTELGVFDER